MLTAASGGVTITTVYDRLGRPTSVTVSDDAGATTTYSYSLTSPSWTDPTGTYLVTLDKFGRLASLDDPATAGVWAFAYRAGGQPAQVSPPSGPATDYAYDTAARFTGKTTGSVASFSYTLSRAGLRSPPSRERPMNGSVQHGPRVERGWVLGVVALTVLVLVACGCRGERRDWTLHVMNDRGSPIVMKVSVDGRTDFYLVPAPPGGRTVAVLDHPFDGSVTILNATSCALLGPPEAVPTVGDAWIFARFDGGFDVLRHDLGGNASKDVVTAERTDLCAEPEASARPGASP